MMITNKDKKVQTAFRLDGLVIARVKEAARRRNISANQFVNETLKEATKDIETAEERKESIRKTRAFLDSVWGTWVGDESAEEILKAAKSHSSKEILDL